MKTPSSPLLRQQPEGVAHRPAAGTLASMLFTVSLADIATTAVALSLGAPEVSPGGAVALATLGVVGLVVLKLLAGVLVWALRRGWPSVGLAVGWGLVAMTGAAVVWNLHQLGSAALTA